MRRNQLATFFAAVIVAIAATASAALAEARHALIIANQDYSSEIGALRNPANDAALVSAALTRLGFEVTIEPDATRAEMLGAVDAYARRLARDGADAVGFFYYSGHGAAKPETERNYLIPVDAGDPLDPLFWHQSAPLEDIRETLTEIAPQASHIVVFDACRNELQLPVRGAKGFTPVSDWGGMLIAYSTSPGKTASDGEAGDPGGPYAMALAEELDGADGVSASELFSRVRYNVRDRVPTQSPWFLYGLDREVAFGESTSDDTEAPSDGEPPTPRPPTGFRVVEARLWVQPDSHRGPCPVRLTFRARISVVGGSGTVSYRFLRSDGASAAVKTLTFGGPGTKSLETTWTLGAATARFQPFGGWQQLEIFDPASQLSNKAQFRIYCE